MSESTFLEDIETGKISKHCRFFKMKVMQTHESEEIDDLVKNELDNQTIVFSDMSTSYINIDDYVEAHLIEKSSEDTTLSYCYK
jgi:hypothetical protein